MARSTEWRSIWRKTLYSGKVATKEEGKFFKHLKSGMHARERGVTTDNGMKGTSLY
jgi:hypothetical protein